MMLFESSAVSRRAQGDMLPTARYSAGAALIAALLGFFVITLDAVVVNVALPTMGHELGASITGLPADHQTMPSVS